MTMIRDITKKELNTKKRPDPLDGSAGARLRRMGLLTEDGAVDEAAMAVFIRIFAATFFDDLCDAYQDQRRVSDTVFTFRELTERYTPQNVLLLISLQYDILRKPLPDPVWWLAGHIPALTRFVPGFADYLAYLTTDMENREKEDNPNETADHSTQ